jgi:hypothetical protein
MKQISNKDARNAVKAMREFKGSNTFAELRSPHGDTLTYRYIVFSYGYHFPLFVAEWMDGGQVCWYENCDKWSRTTAKHRTQLHPHVNTARFGTEQMKDIAMVGISGMILRRAA